MKQTPYPAPDFSLTSSEGTTVSLADFAGKWLVLYFYPKDDTPGCTTQACSLRDARDQLTDMGAEWAALPQVIGENPDKSYYEGDGLNKSLVEPEKVLDAIEPIEAE